ncbi:OmpA family protein [Balneola vulgaris]|jgi:outer membrane protein OmpA-like peptidoglycan-associated protein|uniref:OmpA family protein n=1 Tax=Balneola vulgaris TaxID=287535 RepID=UPI00035FDF1C|nr:OmpA family protein [Balneola vulgaris]
MKRSLHFLVLALFLVGGVVFQAGCKSSEPVVEEPVDTDGDGLTDEQEIALGLDPNSPDFDNDGLNDGDEINTYNTDPKNADTDGDGLSDGDEVNSYGTDPLKVDTDGDGLSDGDEVNKYNTDPTDANGDADRDGVSDVDEIMTHNTDPNNPDSDGDGFSDGQELDMGTNPLNGSDPVFISSDALKTINFAFDRSNISDAAAATLADNVEMLKNAPAFRVRVDAYTDHVGGDQYNQRLSLRRAKSVVDFYTQNGISADRIESRGLGKAPVPCMDNTPDRGCEANRRAESHPVSTLKYAPKNY